MRDLLMAAVLAQGLLAVEAERLHRGQIAEREQHRVVALGSVGVLVPGPGRHDEDVVLAPVEAPAGDDRIARALGDVVDDRAGVAVRRVRSPARSNWMQAPSVFITGPPVAGLTYCMMMPS